MSYSDWMFVVLLIVSVTTAARDWYSFYHDRKRLAVLEDILSRQ